MIITCCALLNWKFDQPKPSETLEFRFCSKHQGLTLFYNITWLNYNQTLNKAQKLGPVHRIAV